MVITIAASLGERTFMLLPRVVSPIGDMHELSTNDDILAGANPLPVPLSSHFVRTTTDLRGRMSRNADLPRTFSIDGMGLGKNQPVITAQGDPSLRGDIRGGEPNCLAGVRGDELRNRIASRPAGGRATRPLSMPASCNVRGRAREASPAPLLS